jgi:hypothetical protein
VKRWIFWVSIMLSAISLTLVISFLRIDEKPKDFCHTIEDIDWFGAFLFVSSLTSFLVPISWASRPDPITEQTLMETTGRNILFVEQCQNSGTPHFGTFGACRLVLFRTASSHEAHGTIGSSRKQDGCSHIFWNSDPRNGSRFVLSLKCPV